MANGNNGKIQYGIETEYGVAVVPTKQILVANETLKLNLNKKNEGLLTGGKLGGKSFTMSRKVDGGISTLTRPDDIGVFLACALGADTSAIVGTTTAYKHTFTLADTQPSLTFIVDREVAVKEYSGVKIDSLSFNAQGEDLLKLDLTFFGKEEDVGTTATGLSSSPLKSFRFADCSVKIGAVELEATSVKFDYSNALDSLQTSKSGLYMKEGMPKAREIKMDIECLYDADGEDIRNDFYLADDTCAVEITFLSGQDADTDTPYSLTFKVPCAQLTADPIANISGADTMKYTLNLVAVQPATGAEIKFVATENQSATNHGMKAEIWTTPDASTTEALAATFGQDKSLAVVGSVTGSNLSGTNTGDQPYKVDAADEATLRQRMDGLTYSQHFDVSSMPAGFTWAGSPFVTPSTVSFALPSQMFISNTGSWRAFLYGALPTSNAYLQTVINYLAGTSNYGFVGLRYDDGSDNNYIELGLYNYGWSYHVAKIYKRIGGGAVTETTDAVNFYMPQMFVVSTSQYGTKWSSWGCNLNLGLTGQGATALIAYRIGVSGLSFTPTRFGIVFRGNTEFSSLTDAYYKD